MLLQEIGQSQEPGAKTIIFVETKRKVENITRNIRRYGWPAVCMHGDKTQQERDEVLYQFKQGRASILVATDVAARGLGESIWPYGFYFLTCDVVGFFIYSPSNQLLCNYKGLKVIFSFFLSMILYIMKITLLLFYIFRGTGGKLLCSI